MAEQSEADPAVHDVALEALRSDYDRPARLLLGIATSIALVVSVTVSIATITVLGPYWSGGSGGFFALVVFTGFAVAVASAVVLVLLFSSGWRITRAISTWSRAASTSARTPGSPVVPGDWLDAQDVVVTRGLFLAASGAVIIATVGATFGLSEAESGTFVAPLVSATILQVVVWLAVGGGVLRVVRALRASRRR